MTQGDESLSTTQYSKVCRDCGEERLVSEFSPRKNSKDGLYSYCNACNAARAAAYREANPDKIAAQKAAYDARNPDREAARKAAWRAENPGYGRIWRQANPERNAAYSRNYLARKSNALGHHTVQDVEAQLAAQKGKCYWCNTRVGNDYHVDHVVPLSRGGSNWPSNLVIACSTCNLSKQDKLPMDFAGRLF